MVGIDVIITALVGLFTTIVSGWVSWFFTRKKYNSEVDENLIHNMRESLEFYKQLSDDNRERLEEMLKKNDTLEQEVNELRKRMFDLMSSICTDLTCQLRKRGITDINNG